MRALRAAAVGLLVALISCAPLGDYATKLVHPPAPPTYSQYHLYGFTWATVNRVVVLPFLNESEFTRAGDEIRGAFTSEFQRLGRFEVVASQEDGAANLAKHIHRNGRFDEDEMAALAAQTRADVVVFGVVTQYSPYPRPRMGLILQAVGPAQAKVVGSVDGLWDTTDKRISNRLRAFYRQKPHERLPWYRNFVPVNDDAFAGELALESPALFQRFICHEAALTLLALPVPGVECVEPPPLSGLQPYPPAPPPWWIGPPQPAPLWAFPPPPGYVPPPLADAGGGGQPGCAPGNPQTPPTAANGNAPAAASQNKQ
jgi:hypothetical protein